MSVVIPFHGTPRVMRHFDDTSVDVEDLRERLIACPEFIYEAMGEADHRAMAQAYLDNDALRVVDLIRIAVSKYVEIVLDNAQRDRNPEQALRKIEWTWFPSPPPWGAAA